MRPAGRMAITRRIDHCRRQTIAGGKQPTLYYREGRSPLFRRLPPLFMSTSPWPVFLVLVVLLALSCQTTRRPPNQMTCGELQEELLVSPPQQAVGDYLARIGNWADSLQTAHRDVRFIGSSPSEFEAQMTKCLLAVHPDITDIEINRAGSSVQYKLGSDSEWRSLTLERPTSSR